MKYYIPTSSLNLDNILQAECVSPVGFYCQRLTGYKSFEVIEGIKHCNSTVLYDVPVDFEINDPNRYNFPVLIEVEDDEQLGLQVQKVDEHTYFCNQTIWITPYNCRIYFYDEKAYRITIVNTEANKSIKFYKDYTILKDANGLKKIPMPIVAPKDDRPQFCRETFFDKMKGIMYATLLGHYSKRTPSLARQIRIGQDIYNLTAAVKATPGYADNFKQKLSSFLDEYRIVDDEELRNSKVFEDNLQNDMGRFKFLKDCMIGLLKKWGVWDSIHETLSKKWGCSWLPKIDMSKGFTEHDYLSVNEVVERRTNAAIRKYNTTIGEANLSCVSLEGDKLVIKDAPFVSLVANHIVGKKVASEVLRSNPSGFYMETMTKVVELYKARNGEKAWEESEEKGYVNGLYSHLNDRSVVFNLASIRNIEFVSIAAVILHGSSFKNLVNALKMNEVHDFTYSFILWGALTGYCEFNKDDFSKVLTMENFANVYEALTNRKMGKILADSSEERLTKETEVEEVTVSRKEEIWIIIESKLNEIPKKEEREAFKQALEEWDGISIGILLASLQTKKGWKKPKDVLKKDIIYSLEKESAREKSRADSEPIIPFEDSARIIDYKHEALSLLDEIEFSQEDKKQFKELLDRFLSKYQPKGWYYEKPEEYPTNNDAVIEHFGNWCFSKNCGNVERNQHNQNCVTIIKKQLKEHFL